MKVIIRVQSPLLKRLFRPQRRIEKLPRFYHESRRTQGNSSSPLAVWVSSIVTAIACVSVAMVASLEPSALSKLAGVGEGMIQQVAAARAEMPLEAERPPAASFPYGSLPPRQSMVSPNTRPSLAPASLETGFPAQ